ncbi:MAG: biotin--[acetyl-CoA-carboxylase] ligase [Legionellaceae bacterium]|nr:biotin--[acetyl-CoA-carboxylase] ligase [Legionellaceae bacterium]
MNLLNEEIIRQHVLPLKLNDLFDIHILQSTDSTNLYLKQFRNQSKINICCSEAQTNGRGRFNRVWYSPYAENIYFSCRWEFNLPINKLSSLSIVTGISIVEALSIFGFSDDIAIKWPNDILWKNKKLAGVLVELMCDSSGKVSAIIGVGLNVNTNTKLTQEVIDKPWCSLSEVMGHNCDRNIIISHLINQLYININSYIRNGFSGFMPRWNSVDYLYGKDVVVDQLSQKIYGKSAGISDSGELIFIDKYNKKSTLNSGEVSLQEVYNIKKN